MKFLFGYVDESGQTGLSKKSSRYLILACILCKDKFTASRITREIFRKFKLGRKKKNQFHSTDEESEIKLRSIKFLNQFDYEVVYVEVKKVKEGVDYYQDAFRQLCKKLEVMRLEELFVASLDNRKKNVEKLNRIAAEYKIKIFFTKPDVEKGLQLADLAAWSIFQKIEKGDSKYLDKLNGKSKAP